ncbi:MAG: DUF6600 domain-containing protein [Polyangiaceae bacterium]
MNPTMKNLFFGSTAKLAVLAILAITPALAGCGAADEDMEAQYPTASTIGSSDQDNINGIPPGAAVNSAQAQAAADEAYARGYAAGQTGGPAEPDGQGSLAVGGDDANYSDTDPSALTDFRTTLDPYGSWVEDENYGTIWVPSSSVVGADFEPYVTAGHWSYDDDYVWNSDYEWGWAPFHYGRWIRSGRGWGWIPGRTYSGAWVSWRTGYDGWGYVGWAPLAPSWYWRGGYAYGLYSVPPYNYNYCENGRVFAPQASGAVMRGPGADGVAAHTRPYVAAAPAANGRVGASPTVNGLSTRGPNPSALGLTGAQVVHTGAGNVGIARAQGFARPQSAQSFGAHAPASLNNNAYAHGAVPSSTSRSGLAPIATGPRYIGGNTAGPQRAPYPSRVNTPTTSYSRPSGFTSNPSYSRPSAFSSSPSYSRPSAFSSGARPSTFSSSPSAFQGHSNFSQPHASGSSSGFTPHSSFSAPSHFSGGGGGSSPSFHAAAPAYHPSSHTSFSGGGGGHGRR